MQHVVLLAITSILATTAIPPAPNAAALQVKIDEAIRRGDATFHISQDDYHFNAIPLLISNASDLHITVAPGTTFWFETGAGVKISESHNVLIDGNDLIVDYDPPPFMQVTVVKATPEETIVTSDVGFLSPEVFWTTWHGNPKNEFIQGPQWWDGSQDKDYPLVGSFFSSYNYNTQMTSLGNNTWSYTGVTPLGHTIQVGDKFTNVVRVGFTWFVHNSSKITTNNVIINTASFMAITEFDGQGGNVYNRMKVIRSQRKNGRELPLVACNADVFHSSGCQHGPTVINNEYSFAFDDYLNIHSRAQVNAGVLSSSPLPVSPLGLSYVDLLVVDPRMRKDAGLADDGPYGVVETLTNLQPDFHLRMHNVSTLHALGTFKIISFEKIAMSNTDLMDRAQTSLNTLNANAMYVPKFNAADATYHTTDGTVHSRVWKIRVEAKNSAIQLLNQTLIVNLLEWNNSNAVVRNNSFHSSIDGVRWKSSNGVFAGNTWTNPLSNTATGLEVTPLRGYLEGPMEIFNVTIVGNSFVNCSSISSCRKNLISICTGMAHEHVPAWDICSGIVVKDNVWK